jgi:hypothetical protein
VNSGVFYVIPLLVVLGLIYLMYSRTRDRRPTYTLSEPWTHEPILWAATDEVVPGGAHGAHEHENVVNVGGGASGRW